MTPPSFTSGELADRFGLELRGDAGLDIEGVATLARAEPGQLAFLANSRYRGQLGDSRASLVVMRAEDADAAPGAVLIAKDPYTAFAKMAALFERRQAREPGIHPNAVIDPTARIAPGAHVGPFVTVGARSVIGEGSVLGPGCIIGEDCVVGDGCELIARVTLVTRVRLGQRVLVHAGAGGVGRARTGAGRIGRAPLALPRAARGGWRGARVGRGRVRRERVRRERVRMSAQWKQRPEGGGRFAIWLIRTIGRHGGRRLGRACLYPITAYFLLRRGPERRASRAWLTRALGRPATPKEIERARNYLSEFESAAAEPVTPKASAGGGGGKGKRKKAADADAAAAPTAATDATTTAKPPANFNVDEAVPVEAPVKEEVVRAADAKSAAAAATACGGVCSSSG